MKEQFKEKDQLIVGKDGIIETTGNKVFDVSDIKELLTINYIPSKFEVVVQPLPDKETKTSTGLILPGSKNEIRAIVVVPSKESEENGYKRGQVVRLDKGMFTKYNAQGQSMVEIPVDYIDGKPCLQIPEHFIRGTYTNLDLSNWKSEE